MEQKTKLVMSQIMEAHHANLFGDVHGGVIMRFMDNVAGATSVQYAKSRVATARVDEIQFMLPISVGAFVTCTGQIAYVGNSSMEVIVTVDVENLSSDEPPQRALSAFFTMVSIGEDGRPQKVKPLFIETEEQQKLYDMAAGRRAKYQRRAPSDKQDR
ncbi:MAG: acyl-CoA thioesterase [Clostridiales Family XIII bacterium]|jgi:acyl-CoA hydrolase|nr:acyl-CoA thioesterase [Clostridiales Family XIII bacterium]